MNLQSIVFNPKQFSTTQARLWLLNNNIRAIHETISDDMLLYKIQDPRNTFEKSTQKKKRCTRLTTKLVAGGIMLVFGAK